LSAFKKKGIRFIIHDYRRKINISDHAKRLDLQPLAHRRKVKRLSLLRQIIQKKTILDFNNYISFKKCDYDLRSVNNVTMVKENRETLYYENTFFTKAKDELNNLRISDDIFNSDVLFRNTVDFVIWPISSLD